MRNFWSRYVLSPFRRVLVEVPWFGPVISAVLVAMLVNYLGEALTAWGGLQLGWSAVAVLSVLTIGFVYIYAASEAWRRRRGLGTIADLPNPPRGCGLIFLFSREDTLREAIAYHQPDLLHCWLLVTPEMQTQAAGFVSRFSNLSFTIHPLSSRYDSQGCYRTVLDIYQDEASRLGLSPRQVVSDITGGTKPMTLGMVLACLEGDYPIEHVPTAFDALGRPTGPLPPIQIRVQR